MNGGPKAWGGVIGVIHASGTAMNASPARTLIGSGRSTQPPGGGESWIAYFPQSNHGQLVTSGHRFDCQFSLQGRTLIGLNLVVSQPHWKTTAGIFGCRTRIVLTESTGAADGSAGFGSDVFGGGTCESSPPMIRRIEVLGRVFDYFDRFDDLNGLNFGFRWVRRSN